MNESEDCKCVECSQMRVSALDWEKFVPTTNLQRRMKEVVKRIEEREERKKGKKRKVHST